MNELFQVNVEHSCKHLSVNIDGDDLNQFTQWLYCGMLFPEAILRGWYDVVADIVFLNLADFRFSIILQRMFIWLFGVVV